MPVGVNQQADLFLNNQPYMLARRSGARSWHRYSNPDTAARRSADDTKYGDLPDVVDHPEVFNDWSGGFGDAYRRPDRLNTYHWAENFDGRWPNQLVHAQQPIQFGSVVWSGNTDMNSFIDAPLPVGSGGNRVGTGVVLVLGRTQILKLTPQTTQVTGATSFQLGRVLADSQSYGDRPAMFGSVCLLPILDGTMFQISSIDVQSATYPAHGMPGRSFTTAGNRLWRAHGTSNRGLYLQSCAAGADPSVTANWSATLPVGDGVNDITDVTTLGDQVFCGAGNGLYAGDQSGTFYNVLPALNMQRNIDNCRDLAIFNGKILAQHVAGVFEYQPSPYSSIRGVAREVAPQILDNRSPVRGIVRALRPQAAWIHAGLWTGSQSYLLAGTDASPGYPYVWHTMQRLPEVARVHRIHVDGITTSSGGLRSLPNRMWVATDASIQTGGTSPLYVWPIPLQNGNPLNADPTFSPNYCGSARMDFPATNWQAPASPKVFRRLDVWADGLAASAQWCDVYYTIDSGGSVFLGSAYQSPLTTLYFPTQDAAASFVTGQSIALSIQSFTMSGGVTPVYRSFVLHGALTPKQIDQIDSVIRVSDGMRDRRGGQMPGGAQQLAALRALQGAPPVKLIDLTGASWWVDVTNVDETEVWQQGSDYPEIAASVKMAVMTYTSG